MPTIGEPDRSSHAVSVHSGVRLKPMTSPSRAARLHVEVWVSPSETLVAIPMLLALDPRRPMNGETVVSGSLGSAVHKERN